MGCVGPQHRIIRDKGQCFNRTPNCDPFLHFNSQTNKQTNNTLHHPPTMTILITGSLGKTSIRLARLLEASSTPFIIASRRPASEIPFPSTHFDWFDPSTFAPALTHSPPITAIYIVPPEIPSPSPTVNAFIDIALSHSVNKFILLAGTTAQKGGPYVGGIWAHLSTLAEQQSAKAEGHDLEYAILRPTWFMQNFSEGQHPQSIKLDSAIYTCAGDGRAWFISADDISLFASRLLTRAEPLGDKDYILLGPALYSHADIAALLSKILNREVKHVGKSAEEMKVQYTKVGVAELYVNILPYLEGLLAQGFEEKVEDTGAFEQVVGRKAVGFEEFAEREKGRGVWGS
ncbi:NAD(P)-binding protein [Amniculicola lignicola CBS 123094]|uniref:NAD(P)-binding protein n=1 Tax=Amniculicola lignicola CBS 123094 TaxID=1392246 RepID=A0A6A5X570_9PLEO|nr:NAD(P)-binding protein [Amniculicola lignicola CBS 123094]